MSGSTTRRRRAIGVIGAGALLLAVVPLDGAQAAQVQADPAGSVSTRLATAVGASGLRAATRGSGIRAAADDPIHIPSVCTVTGYAPTRVIIGASTVKATFSVKVTGCTLDVWAVGISSFMTSDPDSLAGIATSDQPTISLSPKVLHNTGVGGAGNVAAAAIAFGLEDPPDTDTTVVDPAELDTTFKLLRRSSFGTTFNATPEPVKKGKNITLKAVLKRVSWDGKKLPYVVYPSQTISVQFKANGTTAYKTVKTIKSAAGGKVSTTIKATTTGNWRLVYAGNSVTGPTTSPADNVKVN